MRVNKYLYLWVVQGNYGHGWEDINDPESWKEARAHLKETRASKGHPYPSRMVERRVLNPEAVTAAISGILTEPEPTYRVFVRNGYKHNPSWPNGREPYGAAPKTTLARHLSLSAARDMCEVWNKNHNPGKLVRMAEFEKE
jgi:hypothetical protein